MKQRFTLFALTAAVAGLLAGCGTSYDVDQSTVFIKNDGEVVSTDVETFDEGTYDKNGLESFINEQIDAYKQENGNSSVSLESLTVADGVAKLQLKYDTTADYADFNESDLFCGSVAEALAAGYNFDADFASIEKGVATACDKAAFMDEGNYKVVIIRANTNVHVDGKIKYVSTKNVNYVDASTIAITEGNSLLNQTDIDTQAVADTQAEEDTQSSVEPSTEITAMEADTQMDENLTDDMDGLDEEGILDDELTITQDDSTHVEFKFDREQPQKDTEVSNVSDYTNVYTYIIYK